jgi:hypothetical protein
MRKVMYCLQGYCRISLILVVLLSLFIGCSDKTGKAPEKVSKQQNFALPQATNDLDISVEEAKKDDGTVIINGWSAVKKQGSKNSTIYCVLTSRDKTYIFDTFQLYKRPDVTTYSKIDRDASGFNAIIPVDKLEKGEYQIGILIKKDNVTHFQYFGKTLSL